jgi:serine protease Do
MSEMEPSESITASPSPAVKLPVEAPPAIPISKPGSSGHTLLAFFWSLSCFLLIFLVAVWTTPWLVARWRAIEAHADADAAYQKRRAELRAEADAGDDRLQALDKRIGLVSLGFREIVHKVGPCVVNLTSYTNRREFRLHENKDLPEGAEQDGGKSTFIAGTGSGIIVEPGWILTNYHVVAAATKVRVTFASGQSVIVAGDGIKTDALTDLAVLHLPAHAAGGQRDDDQFKIEFGDSDKVERGDLVLALGNPLGLNHSVTHGIISAKGRLLGQLDVAEVLQTDAPINKGNSGGPLFDYLGQLVGVNFAIASETGFSSGIGFAIPSNTAKDVYQQLRDNGIVARGYLGLKLDEVPSDTMARFTKGGAAKVTFVEPGKAASEAGLKNGDVVLSFNKESLAHSNPVRHLRQLIMEAKAGQQVEMEIVRGEERQTLPVTVEKRPPDQTPKR